MKMVKITRILKEGRPHTKGLRSKRECSIFIDMNGSTVTRVRIINYLNDRVRFDVVTDTGKLVRGWIDGNSTVTQPIHTKLYHSTWLEVSVSYDDTGILIEKKRVTL